MAAVHVATSEDVNAGGGMRSGVPWQLKGLRPEARDSARAAARRSGMSVGEWLNSIIIESAAEDGIDVDSEFSEKYSGGGEIVEALARLDSRVNQLANEGRASTRALDHKVGEVSRTLQQKVGAVDQALERKVGDVERALASLGCSTQNGAPSRWRRKPTLAFLPKPCGPLWQAEQSASKSWGAVLPSSRFCARAAHAPSPTTIAKTIGRPNRRTNLSSLTNSPGPSRTTLIALRGGCDLI